MTVTDSEVRSNAADPQKGPSNTPVSDARAREANSKIEITERVRNLRSSWRRWRAAAAGWWVWTERPPSWRATWRLSNVVDPRRAPRTGPWWLLPLWWLSNRTDRRLLFALMLLAPCGLQGPLRWIAARPTRRLGLYVVTAALIGGLIVVGR